MSVVCAFHIDIRVPVNGAFVHPFDVTIIEQHIADGMVAITRHVPRTEISILSCTRARRLVFVILKIVMDSRWN